MPEVSAVNVKGIPATGISVMPAAEFQPYEYQVPIFPVLGMSARSAEPAVICEPLAADSSSI
jgi:hypothetical protein